MTTKYTRIDDFFRDTIKQLQEERSYRQTGSFFPSSVMDLTSNDYLALRSDPDFISAAASYIIKENIAFGSGGSRLLGGDFEMATCLEKDIAQALRKEDALLFNSGYHANSGIIASLGNIPSLHIIADKLCHASMVDGIRLAKAPFARFRHNDIAHLEKLILKHIDLGAKYILLLAESIYSMDGDSAPLKDFIALKKKYPQLLLYIDEAHAIGVRGEKGLGLAEEMNAFDDIDFLVGTFGKALAGMGAYIACSCAAKQYLINTVRTLIFSTMLPPAIVAWNRFIFTSLPSFSQKREKLKALILALREGLRTKGYPLTGDSHIIPLLTPGNDRCLRCCEDLLARGFGLKAIRVPTVPKGTERLRLSLHSGLSLEDIDRLLKAIPPFHTASL